MEPKRCANCDIEVVRKPSFWKRIKGLACCSKKCRAEYLKTAYLGAGNPRYDASDTLSRWFRDKENRLRHGAKQRGLTMTLTSEDLKSQYVLQNGLCWYTGIPLKLATTSEWNTKHQADMDVLSVDRVDANRGYEPDNFVLCCNGINKLKGNAPRQDVQEFMNLVAFHKKNRCRIKVKRTHPLAKLPQKAGLGDVGYDIYACTVEDLGDRIKVGTGISVQPEIGWWTEVFARSSLQKKDLMLINSVGIIDNSYTGEIVLVLLKVRPGATCSPGDRIAQLIPRQYAMVEVAEVQDLEDTSRGTGGFGSTGA